MFFCRLSNVSSILKALITPKCKQLHEKHAARATKSFKTTETKKFSASKNSLDEKKR